MLHSQLIDNQDGSKKEKDVLNSACQSTKPIVVFLHGFLGSSQDWADCLQYFDESHSICVDLPCHGYSQYCEVDDFDQTCQQVQSTILAKLKRADLDSNTPLVFVGYSLGARVAMYGLTHKGFARLNIQGAILEGGNFGLQKEEDKLLRWENDKQWSKRFATESMQRVLSDWYLQGVFASLTLEQRKTLINLRCDNLGSQVGNMLRATSLAKQPYLLDELKALSLPLLYICGENDDKFKTLAEESGLNYQAVAQAGHNVHHEKPQQFATLISEFICQLKP
ncbi:MAG: 2-succinyl-6-hydroxy-2,4-cyclohexadiene-1-carboxylate synthase [Vibrio sp.]